MCSFIMNFIPPAPSHLNKLERPKCKNLYLTKITETTENVLLRSVLPHIQTRHHLLQCLKFMGSVLPMGTIWMCRAQSAKCFLQSTSLLINQEVLHGQSPIQSFPGLYSLVGMFPCVCRFMMNSSQLQSIQKQIAASSNPGCL